MYKEGDIIEHDNETRRLVEIAHMYFDENMTQDQISRETGISRPMISKMLSRARELGIVTIKINDPFLNNSILMGQLKNLFNLSGGAIVPDSRTDYLTDVLVANHASHFIESSLPLMNRVGIGWGNMLEQTLSKFENSAVHANKEGIVCPLIGNSIFSSRAFHPNEMVRVFAEKTGLKPFSLPAPAIPENEEDRNLFLNTMNYKEIENEWAQLDTAIIEIENHPSVPDHATAVRFGDALNESGAVGQFLSNFFDRNGKIIHGDNDFVINIPIEKLQSIKMVIAICSCNTDFEGLLGGLKTGYITHLITSENLALELIRNK